MIPVADILPQNLYSQDDAPFLLGEGFTEDAAREAICEACRAGELKGQQWRKRWFFSGAEFLAWVSRWFGTQVGAQAGADTKDDSALDCPAPLRQDGLHRLGARSPENGEEVGT